MHIGYARTSTIEQAASFEAQQAQLGYPGVFLTSARSVSELTRKELG